MYWYKYLKWNRNRIVVNKWDIFWKLKLIEEIRIWNRRFWKCICECWNIVEATLSNLKTLNTTSCWCYHKEMLKESLTTHWLSNNRLYHMFVNLESRCNNSNIRDYKYYWGRGIKCEWDSFKSFLNDMESSYIEWLTIDRIDVNWNYSKDNCRWATTKEQNRNRRSNLIYKWKCVLDWCTELWLNNRTVYHRIRVLKWSIEDSLNIPIKSRVQKSYTTN